MIHHLLSILVGFSLFACTNHPSEKFENPDFQKLQIDYAQGLRIWKKGDEYRVEIRNPRDTSEGVKSYFFTIKNIDNKSDSISIPVKTAALNSTTFIAYFDKLGEAGLVTGVTFADRMMNENLLNQVAQGKTIELISAGELDFEKVLSLDPDVFMVYSYGDSDFSRIEKQGIPVVLNMEYLETHPLGRAEWIKLAGILTGKAQEADSIFKSIENRYRDLQTKVEGSLSSPSVFTGSRYSDIWYAPGSESYIASYIRDAGGSYVFNNLEGAGSHEIDYEVALKAISDADYWGMVTSQDDPFTMQSILEMDDYYGTFKSFRDSNIFVCNAAKTDYFGDAVMEPDVILADMIAILHPDVLPNYVGKYFRRVE
ncbi:ABC transporter substrate-binding protein [Cryomorpha ignava]|uniref:ABC transporter substrate-binding protein n=1 Tax=Cryomorpha ignava TaxID=101383 RepID=A0A7K3WQJ4_9FLAO|nr:ABC transporter substrate-binding protein [Cryomorpha ignava]NEN23764.1 ABC transporter substrate-binding protein [Cryomorpha ignava]